MGKKYFDTKDTTLESSILSVWQEAAKKNEDKLDPVNKNAVKKKFDDRKDKDIDNDGDVDSSDKFLHKRRKAVSKAMAEATGKEIAAKMMKDKSMKSFASKVAKMKTVSRDDLEKMLPDFVAGAAITKLFEGLEVELDEAKYTRKLMKNKSIVDYVKKQQEKNRKDVAKFGNKKVGAYGNEPRFDSGAGWNDMAADEIKLSSMSLNKRKSFDSEAEYEAIARKLGLDKFEPKLEEVEESYELGTNEYRDHALDTTPGQSLTWGSANAYKQASMKEALAKVWGLDEKALDKSEESDKIAPVKGKKSMTGGKVADVDVDPEMKKEDK